MNYYKLNKHKMTNTNRRYEYGQDGRTLGYAINEQDAYQLALALANRTGRRAYYRLESARNGCGWAYPETN